MIFGLFPALSEFADYLFAVIGAECAPCRQMDVVADKAGRPVCQQGLHAPNMHAAGTDDDIAV